MPSSVSIACLSTSRADAGIYRPLLRALAADARFNATLVSSHAQKPTDLSGVKTVEVKLDQSGEDPPAVARAAGTAVAAFAEALITCQPDLVFVLGDRSEMLAAAMAATICTIPIAHLHGGDATHGAYDDACRHAITKLAHVHFPALPDHGRVLRALGEADDRIHVAGALALDELIKFRPDPLEACSAAVGLELRKPTLLVIFHPETISDNPVSSQVECVVQALAATDMQILWIDPNADVGHGAIHDAIDKLVADRTGTVRVKSLSQDLFWNCLVHCRVLVGNSSAGLIEAASLKCPVVNIGRRQEGRVRGANVIDVDFDAERIEHTIQRAASDQFRATLSDVVNPYGDGRAAERILAVLAELPDRMTLLRKPPPGGVTA